MLNLFEFARCLFLYFGKYVLKVYISEQQLPTVKNSEPQSTTVDTEPRDSQAHTR